MKNVKILIVAAHPDDEILGCGGLINKTYLQGIASYVLILTDGAKNRYIKQKGRALKESAFAANKKVGTKEVFFQEFPNQELDTVGLLKITQSIEYYIETLGASYIFTHHGGDLNKDHRIVYEATLTAVRPFPGQKATRLYTYPVASSSEWNSDRQEDAFIPNFFFDIRDTIDTKIKAMQCYESECRLYPHPRSIEAIKAYANYWGITVGMKYAEPFRLIRDISGRI